MAHAFAATRPVNPPGAEPVLTEAQLWKGLEYKLRNPLASTLLLDECSLSSPSRTRAPLSRRRQKHTPPPLYVLSLQIPPVTLISVFVEQMYFEMSTGQRIANIISYGPDNELLLTYSFANGIPGVPAEKPKPSPEELNAMLNKAIDRGLTIFREMVKEGRL
ncbi:DUF1857-domain-containing protein [Mycena filopes]|nr:DUF1857-domain-containing protein [Mycena filopes]